MTISRRELLHQLGIAAGAVTAAHLIGREVWPAGRAGAAALPAADFKTLAGAALQRAKALGCSYAGVRLDLRRPSALAPKARTHPWVAPPLSEHSGPSRRHQLTFWRAMSEAARGRGESAVKIRGEETYFASTRGECSHQARVWAA
jgi:hypothetical protein